MEINPVLEKLPATLETLKDRFGAQGFLLFGKPSYHTTNMSVHKFYLRHILR